MGVSDLCTQITNIYQQAKLRGVGIDDIMNSVTSNIHAHDLNVDEKVRVSSHILNMLSKDERRTLSMYLLEEQVLEQRKKLTHWSTITAQSSQIDTGYIAQHLVSLQTQIAGQGMRGKGDDLCDGSEVKSANYLDSLDKKGAVAPRWNFNAVTIDIMERFLTYPAVYLLSIDLNPQQCFRTRIWKINVSRHTVLKNRYEEWMQKLGYHKLRGEMSGQANFQLFPPHNGADENFARHGNGREDGFSKIRIELENPSEGAELVFRADECNGKMVISQF